MNWDAIGAVAEAVGGIGVIVTLGYLAVQVRAANRVASAQSRQSLSEFSMQISMFRAEHADRIARIASTPNLSSADEEFQYWCHMQMMTYGEVYFHRFQLDLVPESHWLGFTRWIEDYVRSRGFEAFWARDETSFSQDFGTWINERRAAPD